MWTKAAFYSTVFALGFGMLAFLLFVMHWQEAPHLVSPWLLFLLLTAFAWLFLFTILVLEEMRIRDSLSLSDRFNDLSWRYDPRKRRKARRYAILVFLWICYIGAAVFVFFKIMPAVTESETLTSTANRQLIEQAMGRFPGN